MKKVFYKTVNGVIRYEVYQGNISEEFIRQKIDNGFSVVDDIEVIENTVLFPSGGYSETVEVVGNKLVVNRNYYSLSIDEVKNRLKKDLFSIVDNKLVEILNYYPTYEPLTWAVKREEANLWNSLTETEKDNIVNEFISSNTVSEKFIGIFSEAIPEGSNDFNEVKQKVNELVNKILVNSYNFKKISHTLLGVKTKYLILINNSSTLEELRDIQVQLNDYLTQVDIRNLL